MKCYQVSPGWWKHRVNHHWTLEQYSPLPICSLDVWFNNQAGKGQSQVWFPCSPQPASWVNRKDLVAMPPLRPPGWSLHPSIPLSPLTWHPLHQACHCAFQQLRWHGVWADHTTKRNPNNCVHRKLMCSFTYQIDPITGECPSSH